MSKNINKLSGQKSEKARASNNGIFRNMGKAATFIGAAVLVLSAIGIAGYRSSSEALLESKVESFLANASLRANRIQEYIDTIRGQMETFSQDVAIVEATAALVDAFREVPEQFDVDVDEAAAAVRRYYDSEFKSRLTDAGGTYLGADHYLPESTAGVILQAAYIANNPHAVGSKLLLDADAAATDYNRLHARYHPTIRRYLSAFGYYDIFLFDLEGNLVYSVYKETDFATNFQSGPYRNTNFAAAYRAAKQSSTPGQTFLKDFEAYDPSYTAPASFISAPVFQGETKIGVAVFQMPLDNIHKIVQTADGLGETGIAYLAGADGLFRTNLLDQDTLLSESVVPTTLELFGDEPAWISAEGFHGEGSIIAVAPLSIDGVDWAVVTEIHSSEALAASSGIAIRIAVVGFILLTVVVSAAMYLQHRNDRQVNAVANRIRQSQECNDLTLRLRTRGHSDLSVLGKAYNMLVERFASFVEEVRGTSTEVAGAASQIASTSSNLATGMDDQTNQTNQVSAAVHQLAASVQTITERTQEAALAAEESHRDAEQGGSVVRETVDEIGSIAKEVKQTADAINHLRTSVDQIGTVIAVINEIADQTNLLALNAAIEAARAGEHGRGFAVVADEVRKLAERTTGATEEVANAIKRIQAETDSGVQRIQASVTRVERGVDLASMAGEALARIEGAATNLGSMIANIANATNEQRATTDDIASRIESVSGMTGETLAAAQQSADASAGLSQQAERLRTLVDQYKV